MPAMPPLPEHTSLLTRRAALGALAAAGAGAVLWPYTPRDQAVVPKGRVELTYWEKWTGSEGAAAQAMVDGFNRSQDRAWVHLVQVSDITAKAMVAIGGGDAPDLVGLYSYSVPGFAEAGAVMPMDAFAGARNGIDTGRYAPGIRALLMHEGRQWAGVNTCYTLALYCNRDLLREAGAESPPRTVAELDELAQRLTVTSPGGRIERAGFLQNVPGWWPYCWPCMFGGRLYDESTDRATCADPACIAAFNWIGRTARRFGPGPTRSFAAAHERVIHSAQDPFITGRVAMIVQGPWLANFIRSFRPDLDYACAPMPVTDDLLNPEHPTGLLEADVLMIPRGCPHPDEAYSFLLYTQRTDVQEALATAHCKPSPFVELSPGFLENHPNRGIRTHDAIAKSTRVQFLPRTRMCKQYSDLLTSAVDAVWSGADAAAELMGVQGRAQHLLDLAAARRLRRGATRGAT
jgi:multiple sugar transport system substrate-binding protein